MANTNCKNAEGDVMMDSNMIIRIDSDLKERFRKAAEKMNPHIPGSKVVSIVVRQWMIEYVENFEKGKR